MLRTRLTDRFELDHPIVLAPMANAGGGKLAAAVTRAGGLGLIGGGYCDPDWVMAQDHQRTEIWRTVHGPERPSASVARRPTAR